MNQWLWHKLLSGLIAVCIAMASMGTLWAGPKSDGESLYQLDLRLTDHHGETAGLDVFRGHPVLVSMFYGRCPHVCPMIISTVQMTESALEPGQREQLRVLMVSLDPEYDTPAHLAEVAGRHHVDDTRWKLARADEADVRKLAAVLGVRYRQLPDGEFNHTTLITLLDADGVPVATSNRLVHASEEVLAGVREALNADE